MYTPDGAIVKTVKTPFDIHQYECVGMILNEREVVVVLAVSNTDIHIIDVNNGKVETELTCLHALCGTSGTKRYTFETSRQVLTSIDTTR